MDNTNSGKKTLGRRKIAMKKIEKKSSLQVAFSKRRTGLFRKASELSVLCGADIAILVQSPANKVFPFGNPNLFDRFQTGWLVSTSDNNDNMAFIGDSSTTSSQNEYDEATTKLEEEKRRLLGLMNIKETAENGFWWDAAVEGMDQLQELEEFVEGLEGLKSNVCEKMIIEKRQKKLDNDDLLVPANLEKFNQLEEEEEGINNYADQFINYTDFEADQFINDVLDFNACY